MTTSWPIALVTLLWSGIVLLAAHEMQTSAVDLDHVILSIDDLERGIEQFAARTGVTAKRGGEHPGRGTRNALVSLGSGRYLEIIAPSGSGPVNAAPGFRFDHPELTLAGWALQTRAIGDMVTKLRAAGFKAADPVPGSRRTPDGMLLEWQAAGVLEPGLRLAPFFIEWGRTTTHPSVSSPGGCTLVKMEVTQPEPARLQSFFGAIGFPTTVTAGEPGMRLTIECPRGRVEFGS